ncbi:MAG: zinc-dependent metalloprotease [Acidimicrobiia bacterium]
MAPESQGGDEPERSPLPFDFDLGRFAQMLQSSGPVNWEIAHQVAAWVALEGGSDPAVAAGDREQFEELTRAAQTHVVAETGLAATFRAPVELLGPGAWAELHLRVLGPVLETLATTLGEGMRADPEGLGDEPDEGPGGGGDPFAALMPMIVPLMLGLQAGSMAGFLARHALGRYDLPLPANDEPTLVFVVGHVDGFEQAWSLPRADLRFYLALHEVVHAAARSVPWVRDRMVRLSQQYVRGYQMDPSSLQTQFGDIDPSDPSSLSEIAQDPEALLGAMRSPAQDEPLRQLEVLTSVLEGYADSVLERVGRRLLPSFDQIQEAMHRHRVERGEAERFIGKLLGLELDRAAYERGGTFCAGVIERAGPDGLNRLFEREAMVPTPAEIEAPGLWLARIDLPLDQS